MAISVLVFSAILVLTQGSVLDPVNITPGSPCGKNEYLNDCASSCPTTCSNRHTQIYQICVADCSVKCDCLPGTLRNDDGDCVQIDDCDLKNSAFASASAHSSASVSVSDKHPTPSTNSNTPCADPNAERLPCASPYNCRPSCKIRNPNPVHCELNVCVVDDCQCKPGHILSKPGGVCIKENECPAKHKKTS